MKNNLATLIEKEEFDEVIKLVTSIPLKNRNSDERKYLHQAYEHKNDINKAHDSLVDIFELEPDNQTYTKLKTKHSFLKNERKSRLLFNYRPHDLQNFQNFIQELKRSNNYKSIISAISEQIDFSSFNDEKTKNKYLLEFVIAHYRTDKFDEANKFNQDLLNSEPRNIEFKYYQILIDIKLDVVDKAVSTFNEIIQYSGPRELVEIGEALLEINNSTWINAFIHHFKNYPPRNEKQVKQFISTLQSRIQEGQLNDLLPLFIKHPNFIYLSHIIQLSNMDSESEELARQTLEHILFDFDDIRDNNTSNFEKRLFEKSQTRYANFFKNVQNRLNSKIEKIEKSELTTDAYEKTLEENKKLRAEILNLEKTSIKKIDTIEGAISDCKEIASGNNLKSRYTVIFMAISVLLIWVSVFASKEIIGSDHFEKALIAAWALTILFVGVSLSLYRFFIKEVSRSHHNAVGFTRISLASNPYNHGFENEHIQKALTDRAFESQSNNSGFAKQKKVENPLPGHPAVDITTSLLNKILDSVEINVKSQSDKT